MHGTSYTSSNSIILRSLQDLWYLKTPALISSGRILASSRVHYRRPAQPPSGNESYATLVVAAKDLLVKKGTLDKYHCEAGRESCIAEKSKQSDTSTTLEAKSIGRKPFQRASKSYIDGQVTTGPGKSACDCTYWEGVPLCFLVRYPHHRSRFDTQARTAQYCGYSLKATVGRLRLSDLLASPCSTAVFFVCSRLQDQGQGRLHIVGRLQIYGD